MFHIVAVLLDVDDESVRTFRSFIGDAHRLACVGITTIATVAQRLLSMTPMSSTAGQLAKLAWIALALCGLGAASTSAAPATTNTLAHAAHASIPIAGVAAMPGVQPLHAMWMRHHALFATAPVPLAQKGSLHLEADPSGFSIRDAGVLRPASVQDLVALELLHADALADVLRNKLRSITNLPAGATLSDAQLCESVGHVVEHGTVALAQFAEHQDVQRLLRMHRLNATADGSHRQPLELLEHGDASLTVDENQHVVFSVGGAGRKPNLGDLHSVGLGDPSSIERTLYRQLAKAAPKLRWPSLRGTRAAIDARLDEDKSALATAMDNLSTLPEVQQLLPYARKWTSTEFRMHLGSHPVELAYNAPRARRSFTLRVKNPNTDKYYELGTAHSLEVFGITSLYQLREALRTVVENNQKGEAEADRMYGKW